MDNRSRRYKENKEYISCACGCGQLKKRYDLRGRENKMIRGHHFKFAPRPPVKRGKDHPSWKGGRKITNYGYIMILRPSHYSADCNGYVFEHRYIYEKWHNCCINKNVNIHHKDGNKLNNNINNLQPMWINEHMKLHKTKKFSDGVSQGDLNSEFQRGSKCDLLQGGYFCDLLQGDP